MGPYVESAITAMYTYARALKDAQVAKCGSGSRGLCWELAEMQQDEFFSNYLMGVDFTFTKEERIPTLASSQVKTSRQRIFLFISKMVTKILLSRKYSF